MRSNYSKEKSVINKTKSIKVIENAHIISTNQEEKLNKMERKTNFNKTQSRTNLNRDLSHNKYQLEKNKFTLNLNQQIKKHTRSKTQYFKPLAQNVFSDDIYSEQPIASKYDLKKKILKRQQSQKRIKSQSLKRLQHNTQSKNNIHQSKTKMPKYFSSKNNQKRLSSKVYIKNQQPQNKLMSGINQNLKVLKEKLRKQKSTYSSKDKKGAKRLQDSKNMTFLNLSQILQRNDFEEEMFMDRSNKMHSKSNRSTNKRKINSNTIKDVLGPLEQRVDYITSSMQQAINQSKDNHKNNYFKKKTEEFDDKSFSFMQNPIINAKLRKSNYSTGYGSIGPDYQLQQMLKLKHMTQSKVNDQISVDLKTLKDLYQAAQQQSRAKTSRIMESDLNSKEKSSARTCRKHDEDNLNDHKVSDLSQNIVLLNLLLKYHKMTAQMLPVLSQLPYRDSYQHQNPQIRQPQKREQFDFNQENKKFITKYNQITEKNVRYQQVINQMIKDGINVQQYMLQLFNKKSQISQNFIY